MHIRFSVPFLTNTARRLARATYIEKLLFAFFVALLLGSTVIMFARVRNELTTEVPVAGGHLIEGIIGTPRFINPLLAISDADRDLTALVYSGLMRGMPDGTLIPDLAESMEMSPDGLMYTFAIRADARFHDGTAVTADDVVFTIERAQDDLLKSPKRASWDGVTAVKQSDRIVQFELQEPYAPFPVNTTLGILPRHLWEPIPVEQMVFSTYNTAPVGSGPYKINTIDQDRNGLPLAYTLGAFKNFTLGRPYLDKITFRFFTDEPALLEALQKKDITSTHAIQPQHASIIAEPYIALTAPLPRVFGVFFNQNEAPLFTNREVRVVLNRAVHRDRLVAETLRSYATPIFGPLPSGTRFGNLTPPISYSLDEVQAIFERNNWSMNKQTGIMEKNTRDGAVPLSFTLTTSNAPELMAVAERVAEDWRAIGAQVQLEFLDTQELNQDVIRPREYEALLFGEIVGRDLDLHAFWHSSQRNDPGLNIALYTNIAVDEALEHIRSTSDIETLETAYATIQEEIATDVPAVFLYTPDFVYITDERIRGHELGTLATPAERFANVFTWHRYTQRVWNIFAN